MINKKVLILLVLSTLINNCSFDNKTGIWGDSAKEKKRISELEKEQKEIIKVDKIYSSDKSFNKEISLAKKIVLPKPQNKSSWTMSNENYQNYLGNIYLQGINSFVLKKKIGKDKFSGSKEGYVFKMDSQGLGYYLDKQKK